MKATHDTATTPTGRYHLPSVKNPGDSAFRPEVIRRKMGVAYDTYRPITDAPASEDNAAVENPRRPQIAAETITNHTAFTGVCVCRLICFHQREPGSALSRAKAKITREASTPWAAPVTNCTTMMKLQIANMPRFPSTSRKSWAIGRGRFVVRSEETDFVAKDAAISSSHPNISVLATPMMMAIGALR